MTRTSGPHWVAECYWPGLQEDELHELGRRVVRATAELARQGRPAGYLGSLRVTDDEVVLFLFQGSLGAVRQAAERAGLRAERILRCIPDLGLTDLEPTEGSTSRRSDS